jgi:hypothetical protein
MNRLRFGPTTFAIVFCCAYAVVFAMNSPLFVYYPLHGELHWGAQVLKGAGPAMAWYGLMAKAAIVAVVGAICVPDRALPELLRNCAWLFPIATMLVSVFLLRRLFVQ